MPLAEAPEQHIDGPQSLSHHQEYTVQALLPKVTKSAEKFWTVEKYDGAGETVRNFHWDDAGAEKPGE